MGLQPVTVGPMPCIGSTDKRIYFFNSIQFIYLCLKLTHTCIQLIIKMQTHVIYISNHLHTQHSLCIVLNIAQYLLIPGQLSTISMTEWAGYYIVIVTYLYISALTGYKIKKALLK